MRVIQERWAARDITKMAMMMMTMMIADDDYDEDENEDEDGGILIS